LGLGLGALTIGYGSYLLSDKDDMNPMDNPMENLKPPSMPAMGGYLNIFPMVKGIFKWLPDSTRKNIAIKNGAPNLKDPILDPYDCNGKNPYHVEEVLANKVWKVTYDCEQFHITHSADKKNGLMLGADPNGAEIQKKLREAAQKYGDEAIAINEKDIEKMVDWYARDKFPKEQLFDIVDPIFLNMVVVKLNSGGLLLYAPVKVHKEAEHLLVKWLESLGPVEYLVTAANVHTMCIPDVIQAFPGAKVIGPKQVEEKLKFINVKDKFDYITDDKVSLQSLNDILVKEGVEVFQLDGDAACNSVLCVVDKKILLECDVCYGHHDGDGITYINAELLKKWRPQDTMMRNFKFNIVDKPYHGYLPIHRFWLMDPNGLGAMLYEPPNATSRERMASSLRKVLAQQYDSVIGVHFHNMTREDFNKSVNLNWNWLDGKPLI
jgi:hypothetical protein